MKKTFPYLLMILIALGSCTEHIKQDVALTLSSGKEIILKTPKSAEAPFPLDSIFSHVSYLQLELTAESAISYLFKLKVLGDHIAIMELGSASRVLLFGQAGDFLGPLGQKGRGPGEFNGVTDFLYNPYTKLIDMLADYPAKIISFDPQDLHFKREVFVPKQFNMHAFFPLDSTRYLFNLHDFRLAEAEISFHYHFFDRKEKAFTAMTFPFEEIRHPGAGATLGRHIFSRTKDGLFTNYFNFPGFLSLQNDRLVVAYRFSFEGLEFSPITDFRLEHIMEHRQTLLEEDKVVELQPLVHLGDHIYGEYHAGTSPNMGFLYNPQTHTSTVFSKDHAQNMFNGMDVSYPPAGFTDSTIIYAYNPSEIVASLNHSLSHLSGHARAEREQRLSTLDPDGNVVLAFYHLK
ncbi:MAG: 6-bladed beta-propeller [Bacteroidota bacterium]